MLLIFDYKCTVCGVKEERYVKEVDKYNQLCYMCGNKMEKITSFYGTVKGNCADKART